MGFLKETFFFQGEQIGHNTQPLINRRSSEGIIDGKRRSNVAENQGEVRQLVTYHILMVIYQKNHNFQQYNNNRKMKETYL